MAENITQCPKCNTSFRISDAHLNSAKGAVRCGSCLYVFNARDFLLPSNPKTQPTPTPEEEQTASQEQLISDNMDNKNDDPYGIGEFSEEFSQTVSGSDTGEYEFNLFEREQTAAEENEETQDESWALDLLADDDSSEEENQDTPEIHHTQEQEVEPAEEEERQITQEFESSYYNNSFHIIEETSPEDEPSTSHDEIAQEIFQEEQSYEQDHYADDSHSYEQEEFSEAQNNSYLDAIEPEPVEFDWQDRTNFWHSKILWASLCVITAATLTFQVAWIKFDDLSVVAPYRSYYEKACQVLSCTLPDLLDRSKIKTANLVVRSHPKLREALVVDAVLQNNARFEQSFPTLDLIFTDKQNKIVAARRLTPAEYLTGELAGRNNMPIKQPIHIAIEISDPGREATGYRISIAN